MSTSYRQVKNIEVLFTNKALAKSIHKFIKNPLCIREDELLIVATLFCVDFCLSFILSFLPQMFIFEI